MDISKFKTIVLDLQKYCQNSFSAPLMSKYVLEKWGKISGGTIADNTDLGLSDSRRRFNILKDKIDCAFVRYDDIHNAPAKAKIAKMHEEAKKCDHEYIKLWQKWNAIYEEYVNKAYTHTNMLDDVLIAIKESEISIDVAENMIDNYKDKWETLISEIEYNFKHCNAELISKLNFNLSELEKQRTIVKTTFPDFDDIRC